MNFSTSSGTLKPEADVTSASSSEFAVLPCTLLIHKASLCACIWPVDRGLAKNHFQIATRSRKALPCRISSSIAETAISASSCATTRTTSFRWTGVDPHEKLASQYFLSFSNSSLAVAGVSDHLSSRNKAADPPLDEAETSGVILPPITWIGFVIP